MAFSAPSGRPKGKQYLQVEDMDITCDNSGKNSIQCNILWLEVMRCCCQLPEIYNMVFQYHTQPLLDVFKALLLVHFHCAQPVWPMRITPTYFNPADTLQSSSYATSRLSLTGAKINKWTDAGWKLPPPPEELYANCVRSVSWVEFVLHIQINHKVSPFWPWKGWLFGILSLSKLEYSCLFRGSAWIWALGALWGH